MHTRISSQEQCPYIYVHIYDIFTDLPGRNLNGSTIPAYITPTTSKPDMVIHDKDKDIVYIIELTVPLEPNICKARERKEAKYTQLVSDIRTNHQCHLICLEVGSRGIITKDNKKQLRRIMKIVKEPKTKVFNNTISRLALVGSFVIFWAKDEPIWSNMSLLKKIILSILMH